jgi:hypothetical protein
MHIPVPTGVSDAGLSADFMSDYQNAQRTTPTRKIEPQRTKMNKDAAGNVTFGCPYPSGWPFGLVHLYLLHHSGKYGIQPMIMDALESAVQHLAQNVNM